MIAKASQGRYFPISRERVAQLTTGWRRYFGREVWISFANPSGK